MKHYLFVQLTSSVHTKPAISNILLPFCFICNFKTCYNLYNNQIKASALIGQSAMVYCAGKLMEKSRLFRVLI